MSDIVWTQQTEGLWTGRSGNKPAGTIEQGRRFTFIDVDGERHGAFRELRAAQAAACALHVGDAAVSQLRAPRKDHASG